MDKATAISALRFIHRLVGATPALTIYAKEAIALQNAANQLHAALQENVDMVQRASNIRSLLENGLLALPPGKPNREKVLLSCEELMSKLDRNICAPDW
jgi:hypothetical protein